MLRLLDNDVLEQVAEIRIDRALVTRLDFEVVRERALLTHFAVGLREDRARRVAVSGARRIELFERLQTRFERRQIVLAGSYRARSPLVFDARTGELRFTGRSCDPRGFDRLVGPLQTIGSRRLLR